MNFLTAALFLISAAYVSANLECYQCTSIDDAKCKDSEAANLAKFKKPCPQLVEGTFKGNNAVGCRKVVQNVEEDDQVVIRECAYSGEPVDGMKKTGNWQVSKYFYQCENAQTGEPCNATGNTFVSALSIIALSLVALFH